MKRSRIFKILTAVVVIVVICLAGMHLVGSSQDSSAEEITHVENLRPVKAIQLKQPHSISTRKFPGCVKANRESKLAFRIDGPIVEYDVRIGQFFRKGDVIAKVDPRDFEISVSRIEATLASTQANLKAMRRGARKEDIEVLKAQRASINASLINAKAQYERHKALLEQKMVPKADYDRVKSSYDMLTASMEQIVKELEKAHNGARSEDIEAMEKQIEMLNTNLADAKNALLDTDLYAPFDGYIAQKFVENYESIEHGQPIVSILDCSSLEVTVGIPEELLTQQHNFSKYICEFDVFPGVQTESTLKELGRKPDQLTQSYPLTVQFKPEDNMAVRPGMAASVLISIEDNNAESSFVLPVETVVSDKGDNRYAWVLDPDSQRVAKRPVTVKQLMKGSIEISDGLKAGEWVVTAGANFLNENQKVAQIITE
jgi:membrane fusion protein, multidrug efflux system